MMLATELSKRLGPAADVFVAHPGLCNTGLVEEQDKVWIVLGVDSGGLSSLGFNGLTHLKSVLL